MAANESLLFVAASQSPKVLNEWVIPPLTLKLENTKGDVKIKNTRNVRLYILRSPNKE